MKNVMQSKVVLSTLSLVLIVAMALTFSACGNDSNVDNEPKNELSFVFKVLASSAVMSVAVKLLYDFVRVYAESMVGNIFVCAVCGVCGIVVYVAMLILLRVKEFTAVISRKNK